MHFTEFKSPFTFAQFCCGSLSFLPEDTECNYTVVTNTQWLRYCYFLSDLWRVSSQVKYTFSLNNFSQGICFRRCLLKHCFFNSRTLQMQQQCSEKADGSYRMHTPSTLLSDNKLCPLSHRHGTCPPNWPRREAANTGLQTAGSCS